MFADRSLPLVILVAAMWTSACASGGATFRSGVGDSFPDRAPYYAGRAVNSSGEPAMRIGHIPVAYQRGAAQSAMFDPSFSADMQSLLAEMTAWLDSAGRSQKVVESNSEYGGAGSPLRTPPDVSFGCITASSAPGDECAERGDSALGRGKQRMRLAVARPSPQWIASMDSAMQKKSVDAMLVLTLEVGQYLVRERGLIGTKEIELGTGRVETLPWLTSLETPVSVLQLTGALIGRDGRAIRIGAEGLLARRTPLLASAVGAQRLISDANVAELRSLRRTDLSGNPLVWQVALKYLVDQLTQPPR